MKPRKAILTHRHQDDAFSVHELIVLLALISLIALIMIGGGSMLRKWKLRSNQATCSENLRRIGAAIQLYAQENAGKLPYAALQEGDTKWLSWDDLLSTQLGETRSPQDLAAPVSRQRLEVLRCPSDSSEVVWSPKPAFRRTYAMPAFIQSPANWPPSKSSETGIGLQMVVTNSIAHIEGPKSYSLFSRTQSGNKQSITVEIIGAPEATIALTERVHPRNLIGSIRESTIPNSTEHIHYQLPVSFRDYHASRFSFLMIDGHVESLAPLATVRTNSSPSLQSGMWTIAPND